MGKLLLGNSWKKDKRKSKCKRRREELRERRGWVKHASR